MKLKILLFLFSFLTCALNLSLSRAQEIDVSAEIFDEEVTGTIESINYEIPVIKVRSYVDPTMTEYQENDFYVLEEAVIEKDGKQIKYQDLMAGEEVTLRYRIGVDGRKEVNHIWVKES